MARAAAIKQEPFLGQPQPYLTDDKSSLNHLAMRTGPGLPSHLALQQLQMAPDAYSRSYLSGYQHLQGQLQQIPARPPMSYGCAAAPHLQALAPSSQAYSAPNDMQRKRQRDDFDQVGHHPQQTSCLCVLTGSGMKPRQFVMLAPCVLLQVRWWTLSIESGVHDCHQASDQCCYHWCISRNRHATDKPRHNISGNQKLLLNADRILACSGPCTCPHFAVPIIIKCSDAHIVTIIADWPACGSHQGTMEVQKSVRLAC